MLMNTDNIRKLYLIRHGKVDFPQGIHRCIGHTELPLSKEGILQARKLGQYFAHNPVTQIFTSPLGRCLETAEILSDGRYPVLAVPELRELDMGEWENVPLRQLKKNLESEPAQGEGRRAGLLRFQKALNGILKETTGDIACVAHAGVNCCYLSMILGTPIETSRALPQPYGGISSILIDREGNMQVAELGVMPEKYPNKKACENIWEHYHTPEQVRNHCVAVCEQAMQIGDKLNQSGYALDRELILSAALLHDVVRSRPNHAIEGAKILVREGYPLLAEIVGRHHDLSMDMTQILLGKRVWGQCQESPNEAEVVYLADKLVMENQVVTLEERFAGSRRRCMQKTDAEAALAALERRYQEAKSVEKKLRLCIERGK